MKIITLNVNGIRSAQKKGLFRWLSNQNADVICLQEVRANEDVVNSPLFELPGYEAYIEHAEKSGYSGVGIYTRRSPKKVVEKLGFNLSDQEGRYLHVEFDDLVIASIYFPSGTSSEARQTQKYLFMEKIEVIFEKYRKSKKRYILTGDWNIAHKPIDLKNWKTNQKNSGFLPEERAWLDKLFDEYGWVDAFRVVNQNELEYTWWSNRGRAWDNNVGWRIDYQIVSPNLKDKIVSAEIYKAERFSDHAPLIMEYKL